MTRFARAKGSKASNERIPEESTPWTIMKKNLLENTNNLKMENDVKEMNKQKIANYKNFLKEKEEEESKHTVWASFPVQRNKSLLLDNKSKKSFKAKTLTNDIAKGKTKNTEKKLKLVLNKEKQMKDSINKNSDNSMHQKYKKDVKIRGNIGKGAKKQENIKKVDVLTKLKKKKTKQINGEQGDDSIETNKSPRSHSSTRNSKNKKNKVVEGKKNEESEKQKSKKNAKNAKKEKTELTESDFKKIEKKKQKKIKQLLKKKQLKEKLKEQNINNDQNLNKQVISKNKGTVINESSTTETKLELTDLKPKVENNSGKSPKKQMASQKIKKKKIPGSEPQRRKSTLPHKMFINGKELEIAYVEGFPVKKEDADRLKKLRKEMISKGLPRSQIDIALKLERRRAEKALAREKKKVCFNCRKSGHNLSECPELGKTELVETTGSGICFKCGSAEHTHFECKVVRGQDYKFAQCFICNEQGHIARQCPDNARGLYPKGGACRVCGDVTHLKKDCPQHQAQQEKQENNFRLQTLGDRNPEMLDGLEDPSENRTFAVTQKQNKIVKFV